MDGSVKLVLAVGVLFGGIALALLFRHPPPRADPLSRRSCEPLILRDRRYGVDQRDSAGAVQGRPTVHIESSDRPVQLLGISGRSTTILAPTEAGEPLWPSAKSDPHSMGAATSRWGTSMGLTLSQATGSDESVRSHTIVDGDTLRALAERYLGSADRYMEIYEANRNSLPGPEVLPIGVELNIPPGRPSLGHVDTPPYGAAGDSDLAPIASQAAPSANLMPQEPLVPIPPGSLPLGDLPQGDGLTAGP